VKIGKAAILAALAFVAACSAPEKIKDAGPSIDTFHRQLDAEAYPAIWSGADDLLRQNASQAQFNQLLAAVHKKLGKVVKSERTGWNVNYGTSGTIVAVGMDTQFEHGKGAETFTFRAHGGALGLVGYNINSADMMLK
jgi:hypothetical protein